MLKGLEISEIQLSELERTKRLDSEFYETKNVVAQKLLSNLGSLPITKFVSVSDGNHMSISEYFTETEGIPYYRGQDIRYFSIEQSIPQKIEERAFDLTIMHRSHLRKGDVLLSIVGTVGGLSLVQTDAKATCSCKIAILRPHNIDPELLAIFLRSSYGQNQIQKFKRGAVQQGLLLEDFDQIVIPVFGDVFQMAIKHTVEQSFVDSQKAISTYARAESLLLEELGLTDFVPSAETVSVKSFKESFGATGRLDAELYQPKNDAILALLRKDNLKIGDVALSRKNQFTKEKSGTFEYIEIGSLNGDGTTSSETLLQVEAPSRATQTVRGGDIITSTVRPIRRLSALVSSDQDDFVCSSGFIVLKPKTVSSETLLVYLRLPAICELMDLFTSASMYPAIAEKDVLELPIPKISSEIQSAITKHVQESFVLKAKSEHLLEIAKRAVEMAIEQDEQTALNWLTLEI